MPSLTTTTVRPYIDSTINNKLEQIVNHKLLVKFEKISIFSYDKDGTADEVGGVTEGFKNVFTQSIVPTLESTFKSGNWDALVDGALHTNPNYGILIYKGPNCNVIVNTTYSCDSNSNAFNIQSQLFLNGAAVNQGVRGGRGYQRKVEVQIQGGGGKDATARPVVVNGNITQINVFNRGTGYTSPPSIVITGSGIEAKATCTLNSAAGIDTITLSSVKPCPDGIPGLFPTTQNKPFSVNRTYNLDLVYGDRLELRSVSSDTGNTASCEVYSAKIEVLRPIISFKV